MRGRNICCQKACFKVHLLIPIYNRSAENGAGWIDSLLFGGLEKTMQLMLWWVRRLEDHLIQTSVNMNGVQKNHVLWRFSCEALCR